MRHNDDCEMRLYGLRRVFWVGPDRTHERPTSCYCPRPGGVVIQFGAVFAPDPKRRGGK